jgi:hypothetical protein
MGAVEALLAAATHKAAEGRLVNRIGRGERIRTFDPLVPNQMRYQAALRPDEAAIVCPAQGVTTVGAGRRSCSQMSMHCLMCCSHT